MPPKKSLVCGLHTSRLRPAYRHLKLFKICFAMKRCPIAAKIAGLIGILSCCALNDFFT